MPRDLKSCLFAHLAALLIFIVSFHKNTCAAVINTGLMHLAAQSITDLSFGAFQSTNVSDNWCCCSLSAVVINHFFTHLATQMLDLAIGAFGFKCKINKNVSSSTI